MIVKWTRLKVAYCLLIAMSVFLYAAHYRISETDHRPKVVRRYTVLTVNDPAFQAEVEKKLSSQADNEGGAHSEGEDFSAYLKAAEKGDIWSQIQVGSMYAYGEHGAPLNRTEALKWFQTAARRNDSPLAGEAARELGDMYTSETHGFTPDYTEAYFWYKVAAKITPDGPISDGFINIGQHVTAEQMHLQDRRVEEWMGNNHRVPPGNQPHLSHP